MATLRSFESITPWLAVSNRLEGRRVRVRVRGGGRGHGEGGSVGGRGWVNEGEKGRGGGLACRDKKGLFYKQLRD